MHSDGLVCRGRLKPYFIADTGNKLSIIAIGQRAAQEVLRGLWLMMPQGRLKSFQTASWQDSSSHRFKTHQPNLPVM
jgi:hypothetical protein